MATKKQIHDKKIKDLNAQLLKLKAGSVSEERELNVDELAKISEIEDLIAAEKASYEASKTPKKKKKVVVRFLLSPTGKFGLGYNIGEEAPLDPKQAQIIVEAKYAEYVDVKDIPVNLEK